MTNGEIIEMAISESSGGEVFLLSHLLPEYIDLARADERAKMGERILTGTDLNVLFEKFLANKLRVILPETEKGN